MSQEDQQSSVPPPPLIPPLPSNNIHRVLSTTKHSKQTSEISIQQINNHQRQPFISLREAKSHPFSETIEWENIRNIALSENPTAGVFFVETQLEGHVVIVKATATIAQELFGSKIASFLELKTPQIQLIEYKADFKNPIKTYWSKCKKYLKEFAARHELFVEERKLNKELYRAFFLLIELVEGSYSLEDLMYHEELARDVLTNPVVLNDIGRMVVMDIIINNCDRFPLDLIWDHEGNSSNILFSIGNTTRLACIDQPYMAIIDEKKKNEYLAKIEKFARVCCCSASSSPELIHENPYLTQICEYISNVTGVNLDDRTDHHDVGNKRYILQGIVDAMNLLKGLNREKIEEFKTQVDQMKTGRDCDGMYFQSVLTIDVDFLEEAVARMIQAVRAQFFFKFTKYNGYFF